MTHRITATCYLPDFLAHYYERAHGPFRNLSDLPPEEAEHILDNIRSAGDVFASKRSADYMRVRTELEQRVRTLFIQKGGKPQRHTPHYMILGACPWLQAWYREGCELRIPLVTFDPSTVSFTYGDTFPAMRYQDGKPYRGQVYTLEELPALIHTHGLPQDWNHDGKSGPERYIEAQVWDDQPLQASLR
ncbi:MAG: hypothetical protein M1546_22335 [Chloroflexi bacterium]|nr:hypothetical protein [Chloroflexota bacterium]